jgi:RNA polymerase sigma-70 factor, ECF subfamily
LLDWGEADDVTQESFIHVYRTLPLYRRKAGFRGWLWTIATRRAIDLVRKKARRPAVVEEEGWEARVSASSSDPEKVRLIEKAIEGLPAEQRAALVLTHFDEYSYRAAADVLGISVKSLEMHIYRARKTLRNELSGL